MIKYSKYICENEDCPIISIELGIESNNYDYTKYDRCIHCNCVMRKVR